MAGIFYICNDERKTYFHFLLDAIRSRCETGPNLFIFALLISSFIGHTVCIDRPRCDNRADFFEIQFRADFRPVNGKDDKLYQKHFRVQMRRILKQGRGCLNTTPRIGVFWNY